MKKVLAVTAFLLGVFCSSQAQAVSFSQVVVFGDSHSDAGNYGRNVRFSNGRLWVEELSLQLGLQLPAPSEEGGTDYAWGGARTGWGIDNNFGGSFPKLGTQIEQFLSTDTPDEGDVFVLFAGHNDFGWGGERNAHAPVDNLLEHVSTLARAGAKNFVVPNLHPLGHLPQYRGTPDEETLNALSDQFNTLLGTGLEQAEANRDIRITQVDLAGLIGEVLDDPSSLGFTNVTDPARILGVSPDSYLYWDNNHFTEDFHQQFGQLAFRTLLAGREWTSSRDPVAIYAVLDDDSDSIHDNQGDRRNDKSSRPRSSIGEVDTQDSNAMVRLVVKFVLPNVTNASHALESAKLRFFLEDVEGSPAGPVSLFHSVTDNDVDVTPSDYDDPGYVDTALDLVKPSDPVQKIYELDVTQQVLTDYQGDADGLLSAFRLQINEAVFAEDNLSNRYRFTMPGAEANHPQLVLTFVPEPTCCALAAVGVLGLAVFGSRRRDDSIGR